MQEIPNILRILKETHKAVKKKDVVMLKQLSNQTIHTASVEQDPDNVAIAVIVYTLGKIIERGNLEGGEKCKALCDKISELLNKMVISLRNKNEEEVRDDLNLIRKELEKGSPEFKRYIEDVFRKASINKASKIYEHGVSMERTASLLGITMFELAGYAGQKQSVSDEKEQKTISAKERIKLAMGIFGK